MFPVFDANLETTRGDDRPCFVVAQHELCFTEHRRSRQITGPSLSIDHMLYVLHFEANTRMSHKVWERLRSIDREKFKALVSGGDFLETWKFIEAEIFKL